MLTPPRALSLDLDNTLWDTPPVLEQAEADLQVWLAAHMPRVAATHDRDALRGCREQVAAQWPQRAHDFTFVRTESLRRLALAHGYPTELADAAFEVFLAARNRIDPYAEVPQALQRLAQHVPVYALTNGNACVHRVGLGAHFAGSLAPAAVGCAKPDPRMFAALVAEAGVPAGSIWHVGDDIEADVGGAQRSGLVSVWMNRTALAWPLSGTAPDLEVVDLDDLVRRVEAALGVNRSD